VDAREKRKEKRKPFHRRTEQTRRSGLAAYGMEVIWWNQKWALKGFERLTHSIAKAVAGTFSATSAGDTIRAADTPPAEPGLDRRRYRFLASTLAAMGSAPKRLLLPPPPPMRIRTQKACRPHDGSTLSSPVETWSNPTRKWNVAPLGYDASPHGATRQCWQQIPVMRGQMGLFDDRLNAGS
jgi:hypothetical protein